VAADLTNLYMNCVLLGHKQEWVHVVCQAAGSLNPGAYARWLGNHWSYFSLLMHGDSGIMGGCERCGFVSWLCKSES
jgi:hypothetical protein